jgi:hypothetical protein
MSRLVYPTVGKCIYCGSTEGLSEEHIVPFGLGGDHVLPDASCKKCADITSKSELDILRGLWWATRAALGFPSRRKKDMPTTYTVKIETKDGVEKELTLGENEKFAVACFLEYTPPTFLAEGSPHVQGIFITGFRQVVFGELEKIAKKYNIASISGTVTYKESNFARMLAKIAWGFAVGSFGLDSFEEVYVTDSILNKKDDVGTWVGSDPNGTLPDLFAIERVSRHACSVHVDAERNVHVRVRLFSFSPGTPPYLIIVGRLKPEAPAHALTPTLRS